MAVIGVVAVSYTHLQNGEKWLMTTPYFQVALNRDLTQDETRRQKAMKVLNTMLSEDAQNQIVYEGQDILSYSQDAVSYTHLDVYKRQISYFRGHLRVLFTVH